MLNRVLAAFLLASLLTGQAAAAKKTNPPAGQSEPDDREGDARPPRGYAPPPPPGYGPPAYAPAPATGRYVVLTEAQKRCGFQRGCELDSRVPCPPCW